MSLLAEVHSSVLLIGHHGTLLWYKRLVYEWFHHVKALPNRGSWRCKYWEYLLMIAKGQVLLTAVLHSQAVSFFHPACWIESMEPTPLSPYRQSADPTLGENGTHGYESATQRNRGLHKRWLQTLLVSHSALCSITLYLYSRRNDSATYYLAAM